VIHPPEVIDAGSLVLRRGTGDDAADLAAAVAESLDHLAPWMPWATAEAATVEAQRRRLAEGGWGPDDYPYLIMSKSGDIVGACGLHRRIGPTGLEIGYWVSVRHTRCGYATTAAEALTRTALSLPGIERVEIHCDEANVASAGVPRRLGYRLDRIEGHSIDAPAETGRFMIWVTEG
jgi:RimJ/RimL family protein N-acetyltransferase